MISRIVLFNVRFFFPEREQEKGEVEDIQMESQTGTAVLVLDSEKFQNQISKRHLFSMLSFKEGNFP